MNIWRKVTGSQIEKPAEFDTTSSTVVVYQRKNIERIQVNNHDDSISELWQYDERKMTHSEYLLLLENLTLKANIAALEDAICELDAQ